MKRACKYIVLAILLTVNTFSISAQRKISADVEVKQAASGNVATITKRVHCSNDGRVIIHFLKPEEYYVLTNSKGEMKMYMPKSNQVLLENSSDLSSQDELISIFMNGRVDDLGLAAFGYKLKETKREEGYIKKTFTAAGKGGYPTIEVVYENFLPIYCGYLDNSGKTVRKTYFSKYAPVGRMMFPTRMTEITYTSPKDSTVARTVYSNFKVDQDDPMFSFEVPSDAKVVTLKQAK